MERKSFMDIQRLKEGFADDFRPGDEIVIQEKFDGSNASFRYDVETGKLVAFSRRQTLNPLDNTLSGFYNYIQSLNADEFKDYPDYVVFGEWSGARNAIIYYPECTKKWYVFDIYDVNEQVYLQQSEVKKFAEEHGLDYINTYYVGPFISWDHVMSFMGTSAYGDIQEGIIVKNQTKLNDPNTRLFVVKIVGEKFHEIKKTNHAKKVVDPKKLQERAAAQELTESIVTRRRVEKELYKMRDDGIIPADWCEKDMKTVARELPSRIYQDCIKEEPETVTEIGQFFGKFCSSTAMKYARNIILGDPA